MPKCIVVTHMQPVSQFINYYLIIQNKTKVMIREDCRELHLTLQKATCITQDRRVWSAIISERLTRAMASPGP